MSSHLILGFQPKFFYAVVPSIVRAKLLTHPFGLVLLL